MNRFYVFAAALRLMGCGELGVMPLDFVALMAVWDLRMCGSGDVVRWCGGGWKRGSVYGALGRLRRLGLLSRSEGGFYRILPEGERVLVDKYNKLNEFVSGYEGVKR